MPLPIQEAIRDLTGDLLGRGTAVDKAEDPMAPDDMVPILGGALVMVPEVVVQETLRLGEIPENLFENFWEVANIMASLLNKEGGPHVKLADRNEGLGTLEADVRALLDAPVRQRWFSVTVTGYGTGRLGFVAAT
jgi:hypothetical protein